MNVNNITENISFYESLKISSPQHLHQDIDRFKLVNTSKYTVDFLYRAFSQTTMSVLYYRKVEITEQSY